MPLINAHGTNTAQRTKATAMLRTPPHEREKLPIDRPRPRLERDQRLHTPRAIPGLLLQLAPSRLGRFLVLIDQTARQLPPPRTGAATASAPDPPHPPAPSPPPGATGSRHARTAPHPATPHPPDPARYTGSGKPPAP